ncbi:hypothetical protein AYI70_g10129 [Smittium culicis]|uniref:Uncharacterized protein n=1 Tax=Smittium culicis TaxID=133412 RepID=A0A1R1X805_9FUNG|nr:hypothetical protein AYI70_g10129 [Smittium culicis]
MKQCHMMIPAFKTASVHGWAMEIMHRICHFSPKPLLKPKEFFEHIIASQAISKLVLSKKTAQRKGYNSSRWSKPDFGYQNQQEKIQDSQPTQHKLKGQANRNGDPGTDCSQKRTKVEKTSVKLREPGSYRKRNNGTSGKKRL